MLEPHLQIMNSLGWDDVYADWVETEL